MSFDTWVYHKPGIEFLTSITRIETIVLGCEIIGAICGRDPNTGDSFDDSKRYVDACTALSEAQKYKIFEGNARRVSPLLDQQLKTKGE